jgi:hypothetical protein
MSTTIAAGGQPSLLVRLIYLILGAFFAGLTARVLLWEVHSLSDFTTDHLFTIGAVVGAIAAGIFFWHMLLACRFVVALGLGLGFAAATTYCLIGSAGRSDELAFEHNAAARQVNKDRDRAQRNRDEARRRYDAALDAEASECSGGTGPKCLSKRATTQERRSDFEVAEALLQQAKPEQRENGKLKRAAQVIALFTSASEDAAERGLAIIWPFLPPFICELLTITFLHLGFGHRTAPKVLPGAKPAAQSGEPNAVTVRHGPMVREPNEPSGGFVPKAQAERDLITYIALYGAVPSQDFLKDRWRLRSKSTVSEWLAEWEDNGLIARHREGKRKVTTSVRSRTVAH